MRIALFSDIHGNREAFTACLEHAAHHGIDQHVFLGDYIGYGADPGWVLDRVMAAVAHGAPAEIKTHPKVIGAYLGEEEHVGAVVA